MKQKRLDINIDLQEISSAIEFMPLLMKTNNIMDYSTRLLRCFPDYLEEDVKVAISVLPFDKGSLIYPSNSLVRSEDNELEIPYRIYFEESNETLDRQLTEEQRIIIDCIFLRHSNGYVRQDRLERLRSKTQKYIIPFTFPLLGEYVREILVILNTHINEQTINTYLEFIRLNERYYKQTESRMISYWDCYYRGIYPKRHDYIGQQIFDRFKKELHQTKMN